MAGNWKIHAGFFILFLMTISLWLNQDISPISPMAPPVISRKLGPSSLKDTDKGAFSDVIKVTDEPKPLRHRVTTTSIQNPSLYSSGTVGPPAVYLQVKGGLGNQLFQYACHYAIARKNNWPLYVSVPPNLSSSNRSWNPWERDFALDNFNIPLGDWNSVDESWNFTGIYWFNDSNILSGLYPTDKVLAQSGGDYSQSQAFFLPYKDEILEMFAFKDPPLSPGVLFWTDVMESSSESVGVHIRRRDFVAIDVAVPISFHKEAMARLVTFLDKPLTFYIFTDDVPFAESEFFAGRNGTEFEDTGSQVHLVSKSNLSSLEEFFLMSKCKHNIIPNSSFSWWAAYLNPNPDKIVIAAHQNLKLYDSMFVGEELAHVRDFNKFMVRNMYYPYEWITVNAF